MKAEHDDNAERGTRSSEVRSVDAFLDELAAGTPAPGGGSAAALAGALAAALVAMVARLSGSADTIVREADTLRQELRRLMDEDAAAYLRVIEAIRSRKPVDDALLGAAQPQIEVARRAARLLALARDVGKKGPARARSDAVAAGHLARAALLIAVENIRANMAGLADPKRGADLLREAERLST
jgi:formiminotetrahydrofolate cyclodeaminase